jgi:hypothetical protein
MSYEPKPGSAADRAVHYLAKHAPHGSPESLTDAALTRAVAPGGTASMTPFLMAATNHGLVEKFRNGLGRLCWRAGPKAAQYVHAHQAPAEKQPPKAPDTAPTGEPTFRAGSSNDLAYRELQREGRVREADLAKVLDVDAGELADKLVFAITQGYIRREFADDDWWYSVGGREAKQPLAPSEELAALPEELVEQLSEDGREQVAAARRELLPPVRSAPPMPKIRPSSRDFACAVYNDGRLVLEIEGQAVILSPEESLMVFEHQSRFAARCPA